MKPLKSIIPYPGGKTLLAPRIVKLLPPHRVYVEPFAGGASVFFQKPLAQVNVLADLDPAIVNLYRRFSCAEVQECNRRVGKATCTFGDRSIKRVRDGSKDICEQFAARRFSRGAMNRALNLVRCRQVTGGPVQKRVIRDCAPIEEKLKRAVVEEKDFRAVVRKYDAKDAVIYLDPPYHEAKTADAYTHTKGDVSPKAVCDVARRAKGKVLISFNDHPDVREACDGLSMRTVKFRYTIPAFHPERSELLIANFPLPGRV